MRYHTLALTVVLAHIGKQRPDTGRYEYVVSANFVKSYSRNPTKYVNRIYTTTLNLLSPDPKNWVIEGMKTESTDYQDNHDPRLKEFTFLTGKQIVVTTPDDDDEYDVTLTMYNDEQFAATYGTTSGGGKVEGRFTQKLDQVTVTDDGPAPLNQTAVTKGNLQFTRIAKL